jgi:hypothetical protein
LIRPVLLSGMNVSQILGQSNGVSIALFNGVVMIAERRAQKSLRASHHLFVHQEDQNAINESKSFSE